MNILEKLNFYLNINYDEIIYEAFSYDMKNKMSRESLNRLGKYLSSATNVDIQKTEFIEIDKDIAKKLKNSNKYEYIICYFNNENPIKSDVSGFIEYDNKGELINLILDPNFKKRGKTTPEFLINNADIIWMSKNRITVVKQKQERITARNNATAMHRNMPWASGLDKSGYNKYDPAIRGKMIDRLMTKRSDSLDYRRNSNY